MNMDIGIPKIDELSSIDKIALQVHKCHVKWRPDLFEDTDNIFTKEDLIKIIEKKEMYVARIDNKVVGYILLSSKEGKKNGYRYRKELDIDAMGVDEKYRNQGIGTNLLKYVITFAKNNNYTDLRLTVNEENLNARYLYEKMGFKVKNIAYSMKLEDINK